MTKSARNMAGTGTSAGGDEGAGASGRQGEQKSVSRARAHVVGGGTFHTSSVVVFTSWDTDAETEKRVTPDSLPEALGETDASRQNSRTTRALDKLMLRWASEGGGASACANMRCF